jgi:tight adherence protein B
MAPLVAGVTFILVMGVFLVIWLFAGSERQPEKVRRRLEAVEKAERRGHVSLGLKLVRDELLSDVPWIHRLLARWSWSGKLREFMTQAGLKSRPGKLLMVSGISGLVGYELLHFLYRNVPLALGVACACAAAPFAVVAILRRRRLRAFERHFPEALDLLARAVRAGHAFTTGLEMIGKELTEPLAGEFRTTFDEQNFGLPLRDSLINLSERVPLIDVRFFVTSLLIQKETGGNLAEILDGLARVIRDRFRIYGEVRVRTAQGRLTAGILIALPPAMMLILRALNPGYMQVLFTDPAGPWLLAMAATLQVLGSAMLWKIVNIEV